MSQKSVPDAFYYPQVLLAGILISVLSVIYMSIYCFGLLSLFHVAVMG